MLSCIDIEPKAPATATVILLHGLGANGNDFVPMVAELRLPAGLPVRFIFPNAPSIPVTINGGYVMPAWYDITEINIDRKIDSTQLIASAEQVRLLIDREIERLMPLIVEGGFIPALDDMAPMECPFLHYRHMIERLQGIRLDR